MNESTQEEPLEKPWEQPRKNQQEGKIARLSKIISNRENWLKYIFWVILWIALFFWFLVSKCSWLLAMIVLGPPFYYPILYYCFTPASEKEFVQSITQMWTPFWAAAAAFSLFFAQAEHETKTNESPKQHSTNDDQEKLDKDAAASDEKMPSQDPSIKPSTKEPPQKNPKPSNKESAPDDVGNKDLKGST